MGEKPRTSSGKLAALRERLKNREKWPRGWWYPPEPRRGELGISPEDLPDAHEKCSVTIRRTMLVLLGFSLFCIVTTFGTPDRALLASEATVQLPFADVPIGFLGFLIAAPFLLIVLTIYLHVFDGYRLELDAALKLELDAASEKAGSKSQKLPALFNLDRPVPQLLTAFIFYWLAPLVLATITWKALARLQWGLPIGAVTVVVTFGLVWLQIRRCPGEKEKRRWRNSWRWALLALLCGLVVYTGMDLARFHRPLDLFRAELEEAWLPEADLRGADLRYAKLGKANLRFARLQGAILFAARLQAAKLPFARLQGADLLDAQLQGADLREAAIGGARFEGANLSLSDLRGMDRTPVTNEDYERLKTVLLRAVSDEARLKEILDTLKKAIGKPDTLELTKWADGVLCTAALPLPGDVCPSKQTVDEYNENLVDKVLRPLGCGDADIARGLARRAAIAAQVEHDRPLGLLLASALLDDKCKGGAALPEETEAKLKKIAARKKAAEKQ